MLRNRKGFTLIELLIVVVIIGILAAIAIPKFAATKDKAKLASVKTDVRNTETAEEAYFSDYATYGVHPAADREQLLAVERQHDDDRAGHQWLHRDCDEQLDLDGHHELPCAGGGWRDLGRGWGYPLSVK